MLDDDSGFSPDSVLLMMIYLGAFKLLAAQVPLNGWTSSLFNMFLSGVVLCGVHNIILFKKKLSIWGTGAIICAQPSDSC